MAARAAIAVAVFMALSLVGVAVRRYVDGELAKALFSNPLLAAFLVPLLPPLFGFSSDEENP